MLFVQHQCFWFQKTQVEKHQFLVKRGVATKRVFYDPVFYKMWKDQNQGQLGPVNNFENLRARNFFLLKNALKPRFSVFLTNSVKTKMAKLGPVNNSTASMHIYASGLIWGPEIANFMS